MAGFSKSTSLYPCQSGLLKNQGLPVCFAWIGFVILDCTLLMIVEDNQL